MSGLIDALQNELSGNSLLALASSIGASPEQTQSGVAAALPLLLGALTRNAAQPAGASALAGTLDRHHSQPLASHAAQAGGLGALLQMAMGAAPSQNKALDGLGILGHLLGSQQQAAATSVSQQSGMSAEVGLKLMMALAPLVMSSLGTVKQSQGLDAQGLTGYLQQETSQMAGGNPSFLSSLIDPAQDGFGIDDLARVGSMLQKTGILGKLFG